MFHFGSLVRTVGNAFSCSPEEYWEDTNELSPSRLTANKVGTRYEKMVNREGKRVIL